MAYASWSVVFGEQPSAAKWNILGTNDASFNDGTGIANLAMNVTSHSNPYKFSAYKTAAQNSTNGISKVVIDTELFDTNNNFDAVTNSRYVAPVAGFYQFNWSVTASGVTTTTWISHLYKNNGAVKDGSYGGSATSFARSAGSGLVQLAATDFIEVFLESTGANAINNAASTTRLEGYLVSQT